MRRAGILGVGFWAPETVRRNDAWGDEFVRAFHANRERRRREDFTEIERRVAQRRYEHLYEKYAFPFEDDPFKGTFERRVVPLGEPIARGDAEAGARALADARVNACDIDVVMASAIVHDKLLPTNAAAVQDLLGCRRAAPLGVEAYCASFVAQLDLAASLVESGRARYVLCVSSHQVSHVNDMRTPASPMFGDAAGAFVVGPVPAGRGLVAVNRGGDGSLRDSVSLTTAGTERGPWWAQSGPWILGTDDLARGKILARDLIVFPIDAMKELLFDAGVSPESVDVFASIQPLGWFPAAVADGAGIPIERVPCTHARYAHVGGAAIAANLLAARDAGALREGALVALYGHGAGFTRYAALLRWHSHRES